MKQSGLAVAILFAISANSACVPVEIPDIPPTNGQVTDAATAKPILDASVTITSGNKNHTLRITTDSMGNFSAPALHHTQFIPLGYDLFLPDVTIVVTASGYDPAQLKQSPWATQSKMAIALHTSTGAMN